jgi:hypothetical protein
MDLPKWMNIYNSLLRIKFYAYLEMFKPEVISNLDKHFQEFVDTNGLNPSKTDIVRFFGGDMLIGFTYLTLVRTVEYIEKSIDDFERTEVLKISNWNLFNVSTYNDIISKYSINVIKLPQNRPNGKPFYTNDIEKLEYFIQKIRNSISHHKYANPDMENLILIDDYGGYTKMECVFKYSDFINFCMDYCFIVNKSLYELHHK